MAIKKTRSIKVTFDSSRSVNNFHRFVRRISRIFYHRPTYHFFRVVPCHFSRANLLGYSRLWISLSRVARGKKVFTHVNTVFLLETTFPAFLSDDKGREDMDDFQLGDHAEFFPPILPRISSLLRDLVYFLFRSGSIRWPIVLQDFIELYETVYDFSADFILLLGLNVKGFQVFFGIKRFSYWNIIHFFYQNDVIAFRSIFRFFDRAIGRNTCGESVCISYSTRVSRNSLFWIHNQDRISLLITLNLYIFLA